MIDYSMSIRTRGVCSRWGTLYGFEGRDSKSNQSNRERSGSVSWRGDNPGTDASVHHAVSPMIRAAHSTGNRNRSSAKGLPDMQNKPGLSWGPDMPVNLFRTSRGWAAVYYHPDGTGEIIKLFRPKSIPDYSDMIDQLSMWNYGTCELCPMVRRELDFQS